MPIVLSLSGGWDSEREIRDADDRRRYVDVLSLPRSRLNAGMVVCSRIDEYLQTGNRFEFGTAVQILPLRPQDVDEYLSEAGTELASLREACRRNGQLVRLLNTPLTLTVAVLTYRGKSVDEELVRELIDNRLDHLWVSYLAEALPRQRGLTGTIPFSDEDSLRYARGLARLLESAGRDSFRGDEMKLFWLRRTHHHPAQSRRSRVPAPHAAKPSGRNDHPSSDARTARHARCTASRSSAFSKLTPSSCSARLIRCATVFRCTFNRTAAEDVTDSSSR
nr:hypothetical protein [uncultured bacterium]